jgi:hypothetical protein
MADCVNLVKRFGKMYRIRYDPAFVPAGKHRKKIDPWVFIIPCKYGTVYPHGGGYLAIDIDHHPVVSRQVGDLPGCELIQDGDQEKTLRFHAKHLKIVAGIVHPYRKPNMSNSQREEMRWRMAVINLRMTRK